MAYTVLARRYRSGNFDELVGQGHVAKTLKNAILTGRLAHAFLFCGTRGTGKTSSARILAKCLNCEASDKPTPTPCGKCNSCTAISRGDDIDVIEIDAASNTGVDDVRDIIENSQYRPSRSRYKVYIIDEVHALSKNAFNALLKTLEEPPEHVVFILATTEAEKVLPTILSRCQRYDFRNIPTREILGHLKHICQEEKIAADDAALLLVAKSGAGSMRDALSLLDRLLSAVGQELTVESIEQLLGLPRSGQIFDLAAAVAAGDIKATLERTDRLITAGLSPESLAGGLIDHLRNLLILRTCGKDSDLVEVPGLSLDDLAAQAGPFDPAVLSQDIVILEELRRQLRTSAAGRALVDATMVRLALADQFSPVDGEIRDVDAGGLKKKAEPNAVTPGAAAAVIASPKTAPTPQQDAPPAAANAASAEDDDAVLPAVGKVWEGAGPTSVFAAFKKAGVSKPAASSSPQALSPKPQAPVSGDLATLMTRLREATMREQPTIAGFLDGGRITALDGSVLTLEYPKNLEVSAKMLDRNGKRESLQAVLAGLLGHTVGVRFSVNAEDAPAVVAETQHATWKPPSAPASAPEPTAPQPVANNGIPLTEELRIELLQQNPLIKAMAEQFNARVVKVEE